MSVSEERLAAYVDGELDAAGRSAVEAAIRADPALAARLDRHRRLRQRIGAAYGEVLTQAVPDRLTAAVRSGPGSAQVVDLARAGARRQPWLALGAMAACLAGGVVVGQALNLARPPALVSDSAGALVARGGLDKALSEQLAADQTGRPIQIGVSFRAADRRYCRTFRIEQGPGLAGVACRGPKAWAVRMAMVSPPETIAAGSYRMAASPMPAPLAGAVDEMIQGAPLDAHDEASAKAKGWRD